MQKLIFTNTTTAHHKPHLSEELTCMIIKYEDRACDGISSPFSLTNV